MSELMKLIDGPDEEWPEGIPLPTEVRSHPSGMGGWQALWRFDNGWGASVVMSSFTYGGSSGLAELAVIKFGSDELDDFKIDYSTPITEDVLGHLDKDAVFDILLRIQGLKEWHIQFERVRRVLASRWRIVYWKIYGKGSAFRKFLGSKIYAIIKKLKGDAPNNPPS